MVNWGIDKFIAWNRQRIEHPVKKEDPVQTQQK